MSNEVINPFQTFKDGTGINVLAAGTLTFNVNETTNLDTIFSDEALTIAQSNPYTLDAGGRMTGDVRFVGKKRMVVKDSTGATIRTLDNVVTASDVVADLSVYAEVFTTTDTMKASTAFTTSNIGQRVRTTEHTTGFGTIGGNDYLIRAVTGGSDDDVGILKSTGSPAIEFLGLFEEGFVIPEKGGCKADGSRLGTFTTNNDVALNNVYALGLEVRYVGIYGTDGEITVLEGQMSSGIGRTQCGIVIKATFNFSDNGVFGLTTTTDHTKDGPVFRDIGIFCFQDITETVRNSLNQYPQVFYGTDVQRVVIDNVRIEGAWEGINLIDLSGGCHITNVETSCFNYGIRITTVADDVINGETVIDNCSSDIYGPLMGAVGGTLQSIYGEAGNTAMLLDKLNGFAVGSYSTFDAEVRVDGGIGSFGILNCSGDNAGLDVSNPGAAEKTQVVVGAMYSTNPTGVGIGNAAVRMSGSSTAISTLTIGALYVSNGTTMPTFGTALIIMTGSANQVLNIGALHAKLIGAGTRLAYINDGSLTIGCGDVELEQNLTNTQSIFFVGSTDGEMHLNNLTCTDKGTGSGEIISTASGAGGASSFNNIKAAGWTTNFSSAAIATARYFGNDWATNVDGNRKQVYFRDYFFTGTLDGNGNIQITHGLTTPNLFVRSISAYRVVSADRFLVIEGSMDVMALHLHVTTSNATYSGQTVEVQLSVWSS